MSDKIAPRPFCGGNAVWAKADIGFPALYEGEQSIVCTNRGCMAEISVPAYFGHRPDADQRALLVERWNARRQTEIVL